MLGRKTHLKSRFVGNIVKKGCAVTADDAAELQLVLLLWQLHKGHQWVVFDDQRARLAVFRPVVYNRRDPKEPFESQLCVGPSKVTRKGASASARSHARHAEGSKGTRQAEGAAAYAPDAAHEASVISVG